MQKAILLQPLTLPLNLALTILCYNCLLYLLIPHLEHKLLKGTKPALSLHRVDLTENLLNK